MWNIQQVDICTLDVGWGIESSSNLKAILNIICIYALQSPQRYVNTLFITVMSEGISLEP
jgi:hypothetical protein